MLEIHTYVSDASDTLIEPWVSRLSEFGMQCQIHPGFSFQSQTGFLPIKLQLLHPTQKSFASTDFLTGFEFHSEQFDIARQFESRKSKNFFGRLSGRKIHVSSTIDNVLAHCRKRLIFRWSSADVFELRVSIMSSLVIAELSSGLSHYPADDIWYEGKSAIADALAEIEAYEAGLREDELVVHQFNGWNDG